MDYAVNKGVNLELVFSYFTIVISAGGYKTELFKRLNNIIKLRHCGVSNKYKGYYIRTI